MPRNVYVTAKTPRELQAFLQGIEFVNDSGIKVIAYQHCKAWLVDMDTEDEETTTIEVNDNVES